MKTLVELHGGRLTVKSAGTSQGRCFVVELHLAPAAELEPLRELPRKGDSGVMPRYQAPEDDKLGVR